MDDRTAPTMAMALAQPILNQGKRAVLFLGPMLQQHQDNEGILTAKTEVSAFQVEEAHDNGNNSSGSDDISGDLKILCKEGRLKEAVGVLHVMDQRGIRADSYVYGSLLQACGNMKALPEGKLVHGHMIGLGFVPDMFIRTKLVIMYAKCGSLGDARRILDQMPRRNVVSWTAMIGAYARYRFGEEALTLYYQMQRAGIQPDRIAFTSALLACGDLAALEHGKKIHENIIRSELQSDVSVQRALVNMYLKCGSMENAQQVFDKMSERNVVSWTKMIAGYAQNGHVGEALKLFREMPERDTVSWNAMIAGYMQNGRVDQAVELFESMTERNVISWSAMVAGYAQHGLVDEALELFQKMPERNMVSWNTMLAAYAQNGHVGEALELFQKMPERNVVSWNSMISGYAQNGHFDEALELFHKMPEQNVVSWNTVIAACAQSTYFIDALKLFQQMQRTGVQPSSITFVSVLPACATLAALEYGKEIHKDIIKNGFQSDVFVGNALVDMYAKCRSIEHAFRVFSNMPARDIVSWTAMIAGYAQNGHLDEALKLFQKTPKRNVISWNTMISGYAQNGHVGKALELFQKMTEQDVVSWNTIIAAYIHNGHVDKALEVFRKMPEPDGVSWNLMITGYAQSGQVDNALLLFQEMPGQNVVSWNTIIAGYAQNGHFNEALQLFQQMRLTDVKPNSVSFASVLPACANLAILEHGKKVHEDIIRNGFQYNIFVVNALVDMYAKCGSIDDARRVFDKMPERDVISWNAMILGYAMHGSGKEALQLFEQMQHCGTMPNHITFVGVLSACCHAGLADDGWQYFHRMSVDYHIAPAVEHYCCMVDVLGRAGSLDEAQDFISKMPIKPDAAVWGSLLGACRIHTNIELGEHVAECLLETDPKNVAHYVLLSNIYAAANRWDDVEKVRNVMKTRRVRKRPGCSWIEVNKKVHVFFVGDRSHPQMHEIYAKLEILSGQMKEAGYVPDMNFVLHDVEEEQKEHIICHHSEKLAIAFGLIHISPGRPIQVIKNLRICGDCHSATKFISKVVAREIVVRDANRFHHFREGWCSCGDYW